MSQNDWGPESFSGLARAVAICEETKRVVLGAGDMNMQAVNAILLTRSKKGSARGFEEVSAQMGTLSRDVERCMSGLQKRIFDWVSAVSALLRMDRRVSVLKRAGACDPRRVVGVALEREQAASQEHWRALDRIRGRILLDLEDAQQLSAMGSVLSRTAKLEATYGGPQREALALVSAEFATVAEKIHASIKTLQRQVAAGAAAERKSGR